MKTILQLGLIAVWLSWPGIGCHHVREAEPVAQPKLPVIVKMLTTQGTVIISKSQQGPVYSLKSDSGVELFKNITEKELQAMRPELYKTVNEAQAIQASKGRYLLDYRYNNRLPK